MSVQSGPWFQNSKFNMSSLLSRIFALFIPRAVEAVRHISWKKPEVDCFLATPRVSQRRALFSGLNLRISIVRTVWDSIHETGEILRSPDAVRGSMSHGSSAAEAVDERGEIGRTIARRINCATKNYLKLYGHLRNLSGLFLAMHNPLSYFGRQRFNAANRSPMVRDKQSSCRRSQWHRNTHRCQAAGGHVLSQLG